MIFHNKVMCIHNNTNTLRCQAGLAVASFSSSSVSSQEKETKPTIDVPIEDTNAMASELETNPHNEDTTAMDSERDIKSPIHTPLLPATSPPIVPNSSLEQSKTSAGQQQQQEQKPPTKSVRFNQCVVVQPSLHRNNYAPHETAASFYRRQEYESIRGDILKTLLLMRSRNLIEEEDGIDSTIKTATPDSQSTAITTTTTTLHKNKTTHNNNTNKNNNVYISSSRGLDNYTAKGSLKSRICKLRHNAIWSVLQEQDCQVDRAECLKMTYLIYDDEAIRAVYQNKSKVSTEVAYQKGISDALAASETTHNNGPSSCSAHNNNSRNNKHSSNPKSLRRRMFFQNSSSEKNLRKLAAASAAAASSEQKKHHTKQQRRWSLLSSGLLLATPLPSEPRSAMARMA